MFTGYKTRAWWWLSALAFAADIVDLEECPAEFKRAADLDQMIVWSARMRECIKAGNAPDGDERLTPRYVDRSGNTLPAYLT